VRLALTGVYAELPELASAASTGILQLLRRAPLDVRVYETALTIPQISNNPVQKRNLDFTVRLLTKGGVRTQDFFDLTAVKVSNELLQGIVPGAFREPLCRVMETFSEQIEKQMVDNSGWVAMAEHIERDSPVGVWLAEAREIMDLPGTNIVSAECDRIRFHRGNDVLHVIIPEALLSKGKSLALGAMVYALSLSKYGGILAHELAENKMASLLHILEMLLLDAKPSSPHYLSTLQKLKEIIPTDQLQLAKTAVKKDFINGGQALANWRSASLRCADRVTLLATGSTAAALIAGPVPEMNDLKTDKVRAILQDSPRALDLLAFSVRSSAWEVRERLKGA